MRFTERFFAESVPQWLECYLNYTFLKKTVKLQKATAKYKLAIIKALEQSATQQDEKNSIINQSQAVLQGERVHRDNLDRASKIGNRINEMFAWTLSKQIYKYEEIQNKFQKSIAYFPLIKDNERKRKKILKPFVEYLFVESYCLSMMINTNIQAQRRILAKYALYSQEQYPTPKQKIKEEINIHKYNKMYREIQKFYEYSASHRPYHEDKYRLRHLASRFEVKVSHLFEVGIMVGGSIVTTLFLAIILIHFGRNLNDDPIFNKQFAKWRGIIFIILYIWCLGINFHTYERYKINHRSVLEYNYTVYPNSARVYRCAGIFTLLFIVFFTLFVFDISGLIDLGRLPSQFLPLFMWGVFFLFMFNPIPNLYYKARGYSFKLFFQILISFFIPITFPIIWGSDQFVSLFIPAEDLMKTICYYSTVHIDQNHQVIQNTDCNTPGALGNFIFSAIVYAYRIVQSLKVGFGSGKYKKRNEPFNALKYFISLVTAALSYVFKLRYDYRIMPAWFVIGAITTIFTFYWDLRIDWDVLHLKSKNFLLRDKLIYKKHTYYISMVLNFFLRCTWVLYISPSITNHLLGSPQLFLLIIGMLQIIRRGIWNTFRVEIEHIRNCQVLRAEPKQFEALQQTIDKQLQEHKKKDKDKQKPDTQNRLSSDQTYNKKSSSSNDSVGKKLKDLKEEIIQQIKLKQEETREQEAHIGRLQEELFKS